MSWLKSQLPDKTDAEYRKLYERLIQSKKSSRAYRPACIHAVLKELEDEPDAKAFQALNEQVYEETR